MQAWRRAGSQMQTNMNKILNTHMQIKCKRNATNAQDLLNFSMMINAIMVVIMIIVIIAILITIIVFFMCINPAKTSHMNMALEAKPVLAQVSLAVAQI